jgi:N-acetylmuramoyl-L-alanine amidase
MPTDPKQFVVKLDPAKRPLLRRVPEKVIGDIDWYNANRATRRRFHPVDGIEGAVIHATAGSTSEGALSHWKKPGINASAHWIVPGETERLHGQSVIASVYETLASWHVLNSKSSSRVNGGRNLINHWTMGIEVVNTQTAGDSFSDWQLEATARLVRYCWAKYPKFQWVFSHAIVDPDRRSDPGRAFPWDKFVALVEADDDDDDEGFTLAPVPVGLTGGTPCCPHD